MLVSVAIAAYGAVRFVLLPLVRRAATKTAVRWDDILTDRKVLNRISWLAPLVVSRIGVDVVLGESGLENWLALSQRVLDALLIVVGLLVLSALIGAANTIYSSLDVSRERPIKGYLQIAMIIAWVFGAIVVVARLANQSIGLFVGGLGAASAVIILVFKDTILSLVASLQLTGNDMLRLGDWIEMPSQNADGDVIEVALHTVKVQNWDKTITTIPTYKLITDSFKNWRGMSETGARRIKRSLMIDVSTIAFLTQEQIEQWSRFAPLADYMDEKRMELLHSNGQLDDDDGLLDEPRRLTNIGTFRAYVITYLRAHPRLATDSQTILVRQLQAGPHGLPLEIYVFTDTTEWAEYESIQADIFDHLLAVVGDFGLRVHQAPSGADIAAINQ